MSKVSEISVVELFSIPMLKINLTEKEGIQTKEIEKIKTIEFKQTIKRTAFLSVNDNVLEDLNFTRIKSVMDHYVHYYTNKLLGIDDKFTMFASWITKNIKGTKHHAHSHKNAMLSCLIYFDENKSNEDMAPITFINDYHLNNIFKYNFFFNIKKTTAYNASRYCIPKTNTLIVFPGWIKHQTDVHKSNTSRYCLSSNYFIEGMIGKRERHKYHSLCLSVSSKSQKFNMDNYNYE